MNHMIRSFADLFSLLAMVLRDMNAIANKDGKMCSRGSIDEMQYRFQGKQAPGKGSLTVVLCSRGSYRILCFGFGRKSMMHARIGQS